MELKTFFTEVYQTEKQLRPRSVQQLEITIRLFDRWHGSPVTLEELNAPLLNKWLMQSETSVAPKTVRNRRGDILAVWRYAAEEHGLCVPPIDRRIRAVSVPKGIPEAWTIDEMKLILNATKNVPGYYQCGVKCADWWEGFVRVGYDTALRLSDLLSLPVHIGGMFCVVQEKTQTALTCQLHRTTIETLERMRSPERKALFEWNMDRTALWRHWKQFILEPAGLKTGHREGPQKLRRTSVSHLAAVSEHAAQRHLGHATPGLARRHYIDPNIADGPRQLPPEIG